MTVHEVFYFEEQELQAFRDVIGILRLNSEKISYKTTQRLFKDTADELEYIIRCQDQDFEF